MSKYHNIEKQKIREKCDILEDYAKRILYYVDQFRRYDAKELICLRDMAANDIGWAFKDIYGTDEIIDD